MKYLIYHLGVRDGNVGVLRDLLLALQDGRNVTHGALMERNYAYLTVSIHILLIAGLKTSY